MLSQRKFVVELLAKAGMLNANSAPTPMILQKLTSGSDKLLPDAQQCRSIVGSLLYVCHTCPDIAFSINRVAQFMHAPCESHLVAVKRILCYLVGTIDYGLVFTAGRSSGRSITAFADADLGRGRGSVVQALLDDLKEDQQEVPVIWCDNKSTVALSMHVNYVPTSHQVVDGLTKPLRE
ncbi:hypothetical protein F3Y22_tig00110744pilonHSYRG00046 [Hibiscus syriacus]|uniref:Reverse transcriptase Ty1/copia-type domain-containing protein n=1 Tax=Hibiscus syriacus TaxID=106335 RepID=A0A6A2ZTI5_HIBSY|nr:hypothetical protein F3Y22_tig00110744pilonHSYRG00046 [Hibiscus syriacus]